MIAKIIGLAFGVVALNAFGYDINGYCRQVADAVGGSYQIEETCRQQENQARSNISRAQSPARVEKYCKDVGQAVGGSYQIMEACIRQELAAKGRIK